MIRLIRSTLTSSPAPDRCVLFVSHTGEWGGGAEIVLMQLLAAAAECGYMTHLVCPEGELAQHARALTRVHVLVLPRFRRTCNPLIAVLLSAQWAGAVWHLHSLVADAQVVHANSGVAALTACVPASVLRRPLIWHQHDIVPPRRVNRLVLGLCSRLSTVTVGCSRAVTDSLIRTGMPRERLRIEYNCVREEFLAGAGDRDEFRQRLGIRNGTFVLTVVGRLVPRKGQDVFLQALRLLVERDVPVHGLIVGAPPRNLAGAEALYPVRLQAMADHPSLCKRASFLGHCSDIPAILGASDVVVMPSLDDPFPLAVIEALAAGVPVIASRSGGHAEAIADGVTGLLVPPRDAEALAAAVERLRSEPELRDMLSRNGRAAVREHYSEATLPGRLEALYREAMMLNCVASP